MVVPTALKFVILKVIVDSGAGSCRKLLTTLVKCAQNNVDLKSIEVLKNFTIFYEFVQVFET